jgi:hypothetical protein
MAMNKRQKAISAAVVPGKAYAFDEAVKIIKTATKAKFVESVDVAVRLGVDAKKSDQQVRGSTVLPRAPASPCAWRCSPRPVPRLTKLWPPAPTSSAWTTWPRRCRPAT